MTRAPCMSCRRRSWLLSRLGTRIDVRRFDIEGLVALLALPEHDLLAALGITGADELEERYGAFEECAARGATCERGTRMVCAHDPRYPRVSRELVPASMDSWAPPPLLHVAGEIGHLRELGSTPAVAVVGTRRATDYGLEVARRLGSELASAGLPLVGPLTAGIDSAALAGAARADGTPIAVMPGPAATPYPASMRMLHAAILEHGCAISEVPTNARARRWTYVARNRIVAGLACALVVVEAEATPSDLALARFAQQLGRRVLAVPGRVTSPASHGTHELIAAGAPIVRDARDVLDGLYGARTQSAEGSEQTPSSRPARGAPQPSALQERVLKLVAGGADTPERIVTRGVLPAVALAALTELELAGALSRGDGGRYIASEPRTPAPRAGL